ncbi:MAG: transglutaminaseTgpA domain-containing protein [Candidatus Eremiobacteraeota bacterium]|nr:transglutaminaseTgpA domain-containing protein [Candidatus Eremiobacteraeota bacterium]
MKSSDTGKQNILTGIDNYIREKDPPVSADIPTWGLIAVIVALLMLGINFKAYLMMVVLPLVVLSFFLKWRVKIGLGIEALIAVAFLVVAIIMGVILPVPYNYSISTLGNYFFYELANFLALLILLKCYKMKSRFEIYITYLLSFLIVFISSYPVDMSQMLNVLFLSLYMLSSIFLFIDLSLLAYPIANSKTLFKKYRVIPLIILLPVLIFAIFFLGRSAKRFESRIESYLSRLGRMLPSSIFPSTTYLGRMENMFQSRKVVMRIFEKGNISNVRGRIYNKYKKGRWKINSKRMQISPLPADSNIVKKARSEGLYENIFAPFRQETMKTQDPGIFSVSRYMIFLQGNNIVFLPEKNGCISINSPVLSEDSKGNIEIAEGSVSGYNIIKPGESPTSSGIPGGAPDSYDLSVPDELFPEVRDIALDITQGDKTRLQKIFSVERYLQENYKYKRGIKLTKKGMDPVKEFLVHKRSAHCEYFASAMVLMLRSIDIPSRYVVGFIVHEYKLPGRYYVVRAKDAHAWVLAYLPAKGWVEFDPTPPTSMPGYGDNSPKNDWIDFLYTKFYSLFLSLRSGSIRMFFSEILSLSTELLKNPASRNMIIIFVLFAIILIGRKRILGIISFLRKSESQDSFKQEDEIEVKFRHIISRFDEYLEKRRILRPKNLTLTELISFLGDNNIGEEEMEKCRLFLKSYCNLRYARENVEEDDIRDLKDKLDIIE